MTRVGVIRRFASRAWAVVGLAGVQLRRRPGRTTLVVVGVTLSVLSVTLLASIGFGVVQTGERKFAESGRDLWITGGPVRLTPDSTSPIENSIVDSHRLAADVRRHDDVSVATPMAFQAVYVGRNRSDLRLLTGVGIPGGKGGNSIPVTDGSGFQGGDVHYANGTYDGPMTHSVIVDPRTAALFDLSVGDKLYVGGSKATARNHRFTVVGISSSATRFLGTPTIVLQLSELQEIVGTTGSDRATFVAVRLNDGADPGAVQDDLQRRYPEYEVRTNREQLEALASDRAVLFATGSALVVLAIVSGLGLTVNLLALVVAQQRREVAALHAVGISRRTLAGVVGAQGLLVGLAGGALGLSVTPVAVRVLNVIAHRLIGFDAPFGTPSEVYLAGAVIAVVVGTVSAIVSGWQLARTPPLTQLHR